MHQQAAVGGAVLSHIPEDRVRRVIRRIVQIIHVRHHDHRVLAAAFKQYALEVGVRRIVQEQPPGLRRAGKADAIDVHMLAKRFADDFAEPRHDIDDSIGNARLRRQFRQTDGRHRGLFGRLENHRVAFSKRRTQFPCGHHDREIPRQHGGDHADRLAHDHRQAAGVRRRDLVTDLVDSLGMPAQCPYGFREIDPQRIADRLAGLQHFQLCQFFGIRLDFSGEPLQDRLALSRRHSRPRAVVEGCARRSDSPVRIDCRTFCDPGQRLTGGGIERRKGLAVRGIDGTPADNGPGRKFLGVFSHFGNPQFLR